MLPIDNLLTYLFLLLQLKKNIAIKETAANKIVKSNYSLEKVELLQKKHDEN
jgi:hypothetical protein